MAERTWITPSRSATRNCAPFVFSTAMSAAARSAARVLAPVAISEATSPPPRPPPEVAPPFHRLRPANRKTPTQMAANDTMTFGFNPTDDLNDLRMSEAAMPLLEHVRRFIAETVQPMSVEFHRLGEGRPDPWSYAPGQLEVLEAAKDKAKAEGLWNFFLPDAETGVGLKNLDYAYIAVELGKNPLASETMNLATQKNPPSPVALPRSQVPVERFVRCPVADAADALDT